MGALLNDDQLCQWILRRLGAPIVKVELTQEHLDDALNNARQWFAGHKGLVRYWQTYTSGGQNEFALPADAITVTDVVFTSAKIDLTLLAVPWLLPDQQIPYNIFATPGSGGFYSNYAQMQQTIETSKRILGIEQDWRQEGRTLYIFPTPTSSHPLLVQYTTHDITIADLTDRDHELIKKWSLACAKEDLGRIRSKYGEMPGANGSANLDGATLLEEARNEKEKLEEEIDQLGYPMGVLIG